VSLRLRQEIQEMLRRRDGELNPQPENTLSIFRMIRSAHSYRAALTRSLRYPHEARWYDWIEMTGGTCRNSPEALDACG
jgi:hypothetical protein